MSEPGDDFYDYTGRERSFREALLGMVGRRLNRCRLQIVSPEINVAYLGFDDGAVAIQGDIGGELLRLVPISAAPELGPLNADALISVREYEAAAPFLGRRIAQARVVGGAWNGHGVELAFEGLPDQTLVVSSVECEENKTDVHAALRIGTLKYMMVIEDDEKAKKAREPRSVSIGKGGDGLSCCPEQLFERHSDPEIADIGQGGGAEFTVGRCKNCGAVLVHCWVGGVAESIQVVDQALIDSFLAADPKSRKKLMGDWFNSL